MVCGGWCQAVLKVSAARSEVRISNIVQEGRVMYLPVSAPLVVLPAPAVCVLPQESQRKGKLVGTQWNRQEASKLQSLLDQLAKKLQLRFQFSVPHRTIRNPTESRGVVDTTGKPFLHSKGDCRSLNCSSFDFVIFSHPLSAFILFIVWSV